MKRTKPKRGRGRPKLPDTERGRAYNVYLSPAERAKCLRRGATVQDGIRAILLRISAAG